MKRFVVCLHTTTKTPIIGSNSATSKILKTIDEHFVTDSNFLVYTIKQARSLVILDVDTSVHDSASELSSDLRNIVGDLVDDVIALGV